MKNAFSGAHIVCASFDSPAECREAADFVCDGKDARPALQKAVDEADRLGVGCLLLRGTYVINSRSEYSERGAVCFFNPEPEQKFYSQNRARYHVLEGAIPPLGYRDGAVITLGRELYDSLSDDEEFSVFFSAGNGLFGRGMMIRNLTVSLPGAAKPVVVFDGRYASSVRYEDIFCTSFDPRDVNPATAEGIPVPHPKSVGFRGCAGSNFYATEWKNLAVQGFGVGFDIGGEHVYCESLSALYNLWGFRFDCYKGKKSVDAPDEEKAAGIVLYPTYCVNLLDEHNVNMPVFGNASHNGNTTEGRVPAVTIRSMNLQWPNTAPGYTDRASADFLTGRHRATEWQPGSWVGSIEYAIDHTPVKGGLNLCGEPFFEEGHGLHIRARNFTEYLNEKE